MPALKAAAVAEFPLHRSDSHPPRKEVRQGMFKEYSVDTAKTDGFASNSYLDYSYDDARGTFKTKEETTASKGKYVGVVTILAVGGFVVPMAQYFWYVKDD